MAAEVIRAGADYRTLLGAVFLANTLRVTMIVASVAWVGGPALDFTHLILGRIVFFVLAICIYWFVVTRPTLRAVQARIEASH